MNFQKFFFFAEIFPVYRQAKDSFFIKIKQIMQEIQGLIELDIENFENGDFPSRYLHV